MRALLHVIVAGWRVGDAGFGLVTPDRQGTTLPLHRAVSSSWSSSPSVLHPFVSF